MSMSNLDFRRTICLVTALIETNPALARFNVEVAHVVKIESLGNIDDTYYAVNKLSQRVHEAATQIVENPQFEFTNVCLN